MGKKTSKGPALKTLSLDSFIEVLQDVKRGMRVGDTDPLSPLREILVTYDKLASADHELEDLVSTFHALCDVFGIKVDSLKSLFAGLSSPALANYLRQEGALETIMDTVAWQHPFSLSMVSDMFLEYLVELLTSDPDEGEFSLVIDDYLPAEMELVLPQADSLFSEEKTEALSAIFSIMEGKMPVEEAVKSLSSARACHASKAFILLLHLIQDGHLRLRKDGPANILEVA